MKWKVREDRELITYLKNFCYVNMNVWIYKTFVLLVLVHAAWANHVAIEADPKGELEQEILKHLLANYDKRVKPAKYGPVYVYVGAYVRSLTELEADKNLYTIQLSFRQQWYDRRLHFQSKYGPDFFIRPSLDKIWVPDLFFQDAVGHVHGTLTPSTEVRIYPDAQVHCSSRASINVYWPMDLTNFPMDKQVFEMDIVTHENVAQDIAVNWLFIYRSHMNSIQISKMFHFPPFTVSSMGAYPCTSKANTSDDSCRKMKIYFTRDFTYYLWRAFIPTIALVILSWIPLWFHPRSLAFRLSIAIALLVIFAILAVLESGPRVYYLKAMDVWMGSCFCFIFCVLIEVATANSYTLFSEDKREKLVTEDVKEICGNGTTKTDSCLPPKYTSIPPLEPSVNKYSTQVQKIDVVSRFLFPVAFFIFNLVFWFFYTRE